jgi:single-strand DNA-binding protein
MNKVILIGNLCRDPELSITTGGLSVCKFGLAVGRQFNKDETDFFNIVVWRTQADNCNKYLKKGSKVAICGRIENRSYEGTDGVKKYVTDIVADEVQFLSSKTESNTTDTADSKMDSLDIVNEEVPF